MSLDPLEEQVFVVGEPCLQPQEGTLRAMDFFHILIVRVFIYLYFFKTYQTLHIKGINVTMYKLFLNISLLY